MPSKFAGAVFSLLLPGAAACAAEPAPAATAVPITRSTPDVGYFSPEAFAALNVSHIVRAGHTVYFSGIVAADAHGAVVAKGDVAGQIQSVLGTLGRMLDHEEMTVANLVAVTVYTTDIDSLESKLSVLTDVFAGHPPTLNIIGVARLSSPDHILELVATAVD